MERGSLVMSSRDNGSGVTWVEAWELHAEIERKFHIQVKVELAAPQPKRGGGFIPMCVDVRAVEWGVKGRSIAQRRCALGGASGARTAPAALHRALSELYWYLEQRDAEAAEQASF
jgi:hypothetical protein